MQTFYEDVNNVCTTLESSIAWHLILNEGRRRNHRWVNKITMDHKETGYQSKQGIQMTWDWFSGKLL